VRAQLSRIDGPWRGSLAIVPRPRGGDWLEDEVCGWRSAGIDVIASLLTDDEVTELGLAQQPALCRANGIEYLSFPIVDRSVPASQSSTLDFVRKLDHMLAAGKSVAIHCRQGIGRSALMAACLLALAGIDPQTAFQRIGAARGCPVPETRDQKQWVIDFAREWVPVF